MIWIAVLALFILILELGHQPPPQGAEPLRDEGDALAAADDYYREMTKRY
jgi:hypothetical protein